MSRNVLLLRRVQINTHIKILGLVSSGRIQVAHLRPPIVVSAELFDEIPRHFKLQIHLFFHLQKLLSLVLILLRTDLLRTVKLPVIAAVVLLIFGEIIPHHAPQYRMGL